MKSTFPTTNNHVVVVKALGLTTLASLLLIYYKLFDAFSSEDVGLGGFLLLLLMPLVAGIMIINLITLKKLYQTTPDELAAKPRAFDWGIIYNVLVLFVSAPVTLAIYDIL